MEIKLDEEQLAVTINEQTMAAVKYALGGYEVKDAIAESLKKQAICGVINEAVAEAVKSMDHKAVVTALAVEIERQTTVAVVSMMRDALADTICRLRGIESYQNDYKARRAEVVLELKRGDKE